MNPNMNKYVFENLIEDREKEILIDCKDSENGRNVLCKWTHPDYTEYVVWYYNKSGVESGHYFNTYDKAFVYFVNNRLK